MVKNEMLKKVSEVSGLSQKDVSAVLSAYATVVVDTLTANRDEKIALENIGTFKVKNVPERKGIIRMGARTGEEYVVPSHSEITFKMSKSAKTI